MRLREMENKVSYILLLTILIGFLSTYIEFPDGRFTHLNGMLGHSNRWAFFFISSFINGHLLVAIRLIKQFDNTDKYMTINYLAWDIIGTLCYLWQGWPEPKQLIISCFGTSIILFLVLKIWKNGNIRLD